MCVEQLHNIRKVSSLSGLICKTHPDVDQMPINPFIRSSPHYNAMVPCFKFKEFDYRLWKDVRYTVQHSLPYSTITSHRQSPSVHMSQHDTPRDSVTFDKHNANNSSSKRAVGYSTKYHFQYGNRSPSSTKAELTNEKNSNYLSTVWHPPMSKVLGPHYGHSGGQASLPFEDTATATIHHENLLF